MKLSAVIMLAAAAILFSCNKDKDFSDGTWLKITNQYAPDGENKDILFVEGLEGLSAGTILNYGKTTDWYDIGQGTSSIMQSWTVKFCSRKAGSSEAWKDTITYSLREISGTTLYKGQKYEAIIEKWW